MPTYKNDSNNTWYTMFYYKDWTGKSKKKKKTGFKTQREAKAWEENFKAKESADMEMRLVDFVDVYFNDKKNELKVRSISNKRHMIQKHIIPYLGEKNMNKITPADIIQWQNAIQEKSYKPTYLRMLQNQITALFTHACNIYNLSNNPCIKVKKMGKSDADKLNFWTKVEYDQFIDSIEDNDWYKVLFETLFWTGCRIGEVLALTKQDLDVDNRLLHINKTYYRSHGQDVITAPKTQYSVRNVDIPQFLVDDLQDYMIRRYDLALSDRIFPVVAEAVQHKLKRQIAKTGVKAIRVHDFRHSHVAFLIEKGFAPLIIKERCGHSDIRITLNTYGHLYPSKQRELADKLNDLR